jgi:hypothetical protein
LPTGGQVIDSGELAAALPRNEQDQRAYYLIGFRSDDLPFDYITRAPRIYGLTLRTTRADAKVRARSDALGEIEETERDLPDMIDSELEADGVRAKLTAMVTLGTTWQVESVIHIDARDLTFVKGLDGIYRATVDTATQLFDHSGGTVKEAARSFQAQFGEVPFRLYQEYGFDYTVVLPVVREGSYQVRALVRDGASGRVGSARQFVRVADWKDGKLVMSSIVIRGETEKAEGADVVKDPMESGSVRSFKVGRKVTYGYNLYNVAADGEKRSEIETRSELWRDGVRVYNSEPRAVAFPAAENPGQRSVQGSVGLNEGMATGSYVLRVVVTDKMTKRTAWQAMDFEVRP